MKIVGYVVVFLAFGILQGVEASQASITSTEDLVALYESQVENLPPVPGSDEMWINLSSPYLSTALNRFPAAFVTGLLTHVEYGLDMYDVYIIPDPGAGELVFYNTDFNELGAEDSDAASALLLSPSMTGYYVLSTVLVDSKDWSTLETAQAAEAAALSSSLSMVVCAAAAPPIPGDGGTNSGGGGVLNGMTLEEWNNIHSTSNMWIEVDRLGASNTATCLIQVHAPSTVTNRIDVFSKNDITNGAAAWSLAAGYLVQDTNSCAAWTAAVSSVDHRYYRAADADYDQDADGLSSGRERFIYGTDKEQFDTDGDGIGDGEELSSGSDPLNKYSVPPLPMLSTSEGCIVDTDGQPVQLQAENIGGWLAWEQWMQGFLPNHFFNQLGYLTGAGNHEHIRLWPAAAGSSGFEFNAINPGSGNPAGAVNPQFVNDVSIEGQSVGGSENVVRYPNVPMDAAKTNFVFKYICSAAADGAYELRTGTENGTAIASFNISYDHPASGHWLEKRGTLNLSSSGNTDLYLVRTFPASSITNFIVMDIFEIENTASADELYAVLVDNVDASLTLYATNAAVKSGVTVAYDCTPPGIGSYGNGNYIEFQNITVPDGLTNLTIIAGSGNTSATIGGFNIEFIAGSTTTYGQVPVFNTAQWNAYDEMSITGAHVSAGTYNIRVTAQTSTGQDIGNLHSLRFYKESNARALMDDFRDACLTTNDLDALWNIGINCVRIPFNHDLIMRPDGTLRPESEWTNRLDWVVNECAKRRMYCLLDLHGAPGGQNDYEQCVRKIGIRNRLWYVQEHQDRTLTIWTNLVEHFKDQPTVIGYDLLNEPGPRWSDPNSEHSSITNGYATHILPLHEQLYTAIRQIDTNHIVFMEDNAHMTWNSRYLDMLPTLSSKGWTNIVYEIHSYEHVLNNRYNDWRDGEFSTQKSVVDENVRNCVRFMKTRQVPVFIGEFQPGDPQNYDYALRRYNENNIGWCHWNYKVWGWGDATHVNRGWSSWGLSYREPDSAADFPDLANDSYASLSADFADYTAYTNNELLHQVYASRAVDPATATNEFTDFYYNSFDAPNADSIDQSWTWGKVSGIGLDNAFKIRSKEARLDFDYGNATFRLKSREETEAHFDILDLTGIEMSVDVSGFAVSGATGGTDAEICLSMTRDLVTNTVYSCDSPAIIARLEYDGSTSKVNISLYAKGETAASFGTLLYETNGVAFVASATLKLAVNQSTAAVTYNGESSGTISHGVSFSDWTDGGIGVVDARNISGNTIYAEFDNLKVERPSVSADTFYANSFDAIPDEMYLRAVPDKMSVYRSWSASHSDTTYVTNNRVVVMPSDGTWVGTWLNPTRDYQNMSRMEFQAGSTVNVSVDYSEFNQGVAKICLLPEAFPAEIYGNYNTNALYVEIWRSSTNVGFTSFRHITSGQYGREGIGPVTNYTAYGDGCTVSVSVDTNNLLVTYDGETVLDLDHGISNITNLYRNGVYPHFEFQNDWASTNAVIGMDEITASSVN